MRIVSLEVEYPESGWKLEKMTFDSMNLLVGVSGVGKTRILNALLDLHRLASGNPKPTESRPEDITWRIEFEVGKALQYVWLGRMIEGEIYDERLSLDGKWVCERTLDVLFYKGREMPPPARNLSLLTLLGRDKLVLPAADALSLVEEMDGDLHLRNDIVWTRSLKAPSSFDEIQSMRVPLRLKLLWLYNDSSLIRIFEEIVLEFSSIFPSVASIKILKSTTEGDRARLFLGMEEFGVKGVLDYAVWSSGMRDALNTIALLRLSQTGSVILIDEFENGLGANCIDAVTDSIMQAKREHQFIITSHHPFVINNVPFRYWKIITRNGSLVTAHDAEEFRLGKSKHEAFFQLANLREFTNGILQK